MASESLLLYRTGNPEDENQPRRPTQKFFDEIVDNARKIIDAVKPKRAKFGYEMMGWALPDSADSYLELIRAVDRDAFAVHLDPCNIVNSPARFYYNTELLNECFDKLGPWIVSCHAKDVAWEVEMQIHFREVTLGAGSLDYATYLKRLAALPGNVPPDDRAHEGGRRVRQVATLPAGPRRENRRGLRLVAEAGKLACDSAGAQDTARTNPKRKRGTGLSFLASASGQEIIRAR